MYRSTICGLVNDSNPNMFSIRQFQNLFKKIDGKELDALKRFMGALILESYDSSNTFKQFLKNKWSDFYRTTNKTEVENALIELGVSVKVTNIQENNFVNFLSQLIYYLRNSIVHNKETEFHLSYGNLDQYEGFQLILRDFLLAALEEIIYYLLINRNNIVWYQRSSLALYS
jgi:hypothetical protein